MYQRFGPDDRNDLQDQRKPSIHLDEEPAIVVREMSAALHLTSQDHQLMSERGILSLKPDPRLEGRGQDRHDETQEPDHSASLGDSITSATRIRFSVHTARKKLGFKVNADQPRNLLGGMLVKGVPSWPRDMQVIGVEGRFHFLVFPQGDDLLRLYGSYHFADKSRFDGPDRRAKLIDAFGKLTCLPYAEAIAASTPIGPFNSFSNEDHWIDDPTCPGVVLIGDAAGHNDPIIGQGLSIALRDVRLVSEVLGEAEAAGHEPDFRPYVEERAERMRRLRITAQVATTVRVEFGQEARERRARVGKRVAAGQLAPLPASLIGPERLPAEAFLPETIEKLLAS